MGKIRANFADISTKTDVVPDGDYLCIVKNVEDIESEDRNPGTKFTLVVDDPDHPEETQRKAHIWDQVYNNTKKGDQNPISLRRYKQYAEAILGEEAANAEEYETEDFINGIVIASVKIETFERKDKSQGESNKVKRILPA